MTKVSERFIKYTAIDTESIYNQITIPSTEKQKNLSKLLVEELKCMGVNDAYMSETGCVYGTIKANYDNCKAPVIGFNAHVDTTPEFTGKNVKARIVKNYDGKDIVLNYEKNIVMKVSEFDHLQNYIGQDLIVTDGTTLLGADDKAGIAEIMAMAEYFCSHPEIKHGTIKICFTPDEEVGCKGVEVMDLKEFDVDFAYTLDGVELGDISHESFNAATAEIEITGVNIHPGLSKNKMVNSVLIANKLVSMLPEHEIPAHTENYEGYYHVFEFNGGVELTTMRLYIRDHDMDKFNKKKENLEKIVSYLNFLYGEGTVKLNTTDTYYNMGEKIRSKFYIVEALIEAMEKLDVKPLLRPIRGGTDGAVLSYKAFPCPNICTGGHNFHGKYEYVSIQSMEKIVDIIVEVVKSFAK